MCTQAAARRVFARVGLLLVLMVGWLAVLTEEEVGRGRIVLHHRADHLLREQRVLVPSVPVQMDGPWVINLLARVWWRLLAG